MITLTKNQKQRETRLIEENMGLVISLAKTFNPPNQTELEEYIQEGRIGLLGAIRDHDAKKAKLSTLAWYRIRWKILAYIGKQKKSSNLHTSIDPHVLDTLVSEPTFINNIWEYIPDSLTEIERDIVNLKLEGYTVKEISHILNVTGIGHSFKIAMEKIRNAN